MIYLLIALYFVGWLCNCLLLFKISSANSIEDHRIILFGLCIIFLIPISWLIFWALLINDYLDKKIFR
jgi:hypothetical protein